MVKRKWKINPQDITFDAPNLSKLVTKVLVSRGYNSILKINQFIASKDVELIDPYIMKDMQKAVSIIEDYIKSEELVYVYGDYDVDGVTSTAILADYLQKRGANVRFYIPDRATEGYGLNKKAIDNLYKKGAKLIITVDCGITAAEEVLYAKSLGINTIITDHHSCKDDVLEALAVINPKQSDCNYPFKKLAGVGVCFKLICALEKDTDKMLDTYADLVAIGTIADVMPLVGENRHIVSRGVQKLNQTENVGLFMLMNEINMNDVSSTSVSFRIAPRLNAAGRMGRALDAVELILTKDTKKAQSLALDLCLKNAKRQEEEQEILSYVLDKIESEIDLDQNKIIVVWGEDLHHGVVGIVSSRIIEKYNLPVIIISVEGDMAKGSARSIKGFNIFDALVHLDDLFIKYGGHELAAGMTLKKENLQEFNQRICQYANEKITEDMLISEILIDCEAEFCEITLDEVKSLDTLEPYGMANNQPIFCTKDVKIKQIVPLSGDKHLKIIFEKDKIERVGMYFSMSSRELYFKEGDYVNIAYFLSINEFRDNKTVQMILRDIAQTEKSLEEQDKYLEIYERYKSNKKINKKEKDLILPKRFEFVTVWRNVLKSKNSFNIRDYAIKTGINPAKFLICLDAFLESNLITYKNNKDHISVVKNDVDFKVSLEDTKVIRGLLN